MFVFLLNTKKQEFHTVKRIYIAVKYSHHTQVVCVHTVLGRPLWPPASRTQTVYSYRTHTSHKFRSRTQALHTLACYCTAGLAFHLVAISWFFSPNVNPESFNSSNCALEKIWYWVNAFAFLGIPSLPTTKGSRILPLHLPQHCVAALTDFE